MNYKNLKCPHCKSGSYDISTIVETRYVHKNGKRIRKDVCGTKTFGLEIRFECTNLKCQDVTSLLTEVLKNQKPKRGRFR